MMKTIKTGDKVENFTLKNSEGKDVALSDMLEPGKKLVLLFFPLAFSSVCTDELCQTRDNMKMYNSLNTTVTAVSVDSFFTLREFKRANNLNFTLLSDFNKEISEYFGCLYEDFFEMKGVSKRSAFIINDQQVLTHSEILEDSGSVPDFQAILKQISR
jgi:peroxiredoxin